MKFIKILRERVERHKILVQNFSYLSILQIFNLIIPLITYPYLIRVVGKETYGLVVFAQAVIGYLVILIGFGFNISGTKEVSVYRNDKERLSKIVSSVFIIKSLLFLGSLIILSTILYFIPKAKGYELLFYLTLWICIYDIIFPVWYFQGIEQMKYITYITLVSRITFLVLIFVFIHSEEDYLLIPIINGLGALLAGITSLYILFIKHRIKLIIPSYKFVKKLFVNSVPIFLSNVSIRLYVTTNKVIMGAFLGMSEVAYYDLAEKVTNVLKVPQGILGQTLFPKVSKDKNLNFVRRIFNYSLAINVVIFFLALVFSKQIVLLLGGKGMLNSVIVLDILAITVPVIAMSNMFGIQLLIPFGYHKIFSKVIITSGVIYILQALIIWISIGFTILNVTLMTVTTEFFVTSYMFYYCKKFKLWN